MARAGSNPVASSLERVDASSRSAVHDAGARLSREQPGRTMLSASLQDFIDTYDLCDKGVDAIARDGAGRVRFVFELFHCDDPLRSDESMDYRLAATFRLEDVVLHEGVLLHEKGDRLGTILDVQTQDGPLRLGIEWRSLIDQSYSWTSLSLCDGPLQAEEIVSERRRER